MLESRIEVGDPGEQHWRWETTADSIVTSHERREMVVPAAVVNCRCEGALGPGETGS